MSLWVEEEIEAGLRVGYKMDKLIHSGRSKFQTVQLVDLEPFGRTLLIDGLIQSTQVDEFVYHESLVHPALLAHPNPKTVYIGGGGEGSTAREVLRHKSVEKCVMVDIDDDVVRFCRENLPENAAAFADPRLELVIDCARATLERREVARTLPSAPRPRLRSHLGSRTTGRLRRDHYGPGRPARGRPVLPAVHLRVLQLY